MSAMDHDMWRRDDPTAEDEELAMLGERDPADEPREPLAVDQVATLTVGEETVELTDEERELIGSFYDLLGCLTDRASVADTTATLRVQLPEGDNPIGNDVSVRVQPGPIMFAWTHGDPTRGYHH